MGGVFSVSRTQGMLIGDLSLLSETERRLFNLSKYVLDLGNPDIGTVCNKLGIKIVAIDEASSITSESQTDKETDAVDSSECKDTSCNGIQLQSGEVTSLFYLLVTNKPYYFSQTFSQWKTFYRYSILCPLPCCRTEQKTIYIQPVDSFPDFITDFEGNMRSYKSNFNFFAILRTFTEIYFDGMSADLLPGINIMQSKWNIASRLHKKTGQKQYYVKPFHKKLQGVRPADGFCIMGISWTDLYPTEDLNFVLGEANFTTKSGIFCFGRYEPKTYDPDKHKDITELDGKILWRILKVLSHETCHLFGLQHCWYFQCTMNESKSMKEAAEQPLFLCPVCLRKLHYVIGFDVLNRYKKMLTFLTDISVIFPTPEFLHSVTWLEKVIEFLEADAVYHSLARF